jgi:hypothetical protein
MAFGDWDKVISSYEEIYLKTKYATQAKAMLELIPKIREHPSFNKVFPGTSHAALFLEVPEKKTKIQVWCDSPGVFTVYLYNTIVGVHEEVAVNDTQVIPTLEQYLERIHIAE